MTYAALSYLAPGQISTELLGNGVMENLYWNDRLQQTQINVGSGNLLTLNLYPCYTNGVYGTACPANNGNIRGQTIAVPQIGSAGALNVTQNYTYDALNRLTGASEGSSWSRTFGYDAYGNMWVSANSGVPLDSFTPTTQSWINAANNRLVNASLGIGYDNDGNLTSMSSSMTATYDAEDRQVAVNLGGGTAQYVYDGEGRRVQKVLGGVTTNYVYDEQGQLAAEYAPQPAASDCGTPTCYFTDDHLGSTRLVTDTGGNVAKRFDYLPFGEEIFAGVGGRTTTEGYLSAPDPLNPKFTGKLRDNETGLDFMEARYFSSAQGRFTIPDWSAKEEPVPYAKLENPQSLNLYTYVHNNPLSAFDPDGHGCDSGGFPNADTGSPCKQPPKTPDPAGVHQGSKAKVAWARAPGKRYKTVDQAAKAKIRATNPQSVREDKEIAGRVVKNVDGTYGVTQGPESGRNQASSDPGPVAPGTMNAGIWHDHGGNDPAFDNEHFSDKGGDKDIARQEKVPIYVGTPGGTIRKFDPATESDTQIGITPN
jgi:RHS repeat-associated protein